MMIVCALGSATASAASDRVREAITRDVPRPRGTVVLVHGGGWAGPNQERQWEIDWWPGALFRAAGWSTSAIDYPAGKDGLDSVSQEIEAARTRTPRRPVCVYGESAGGHLALLAAAAQPRVRCVMTFGAPTDLDRWRDDAAREGRALSTAFYWQTAYPLFGSGEGSYPWQPVRQAHRIKARVLLAGQADDEILPIRGQLEGFAAVHPRTEILVTEAGDPDEPDDRYLHGTISPAGRAALEARLRGFLPASRLPRRG